MIESIYRLFKAAKNYRNPLGMAWHRLRGSATVLVIDRRTGLRFECRRGADRMMAETFHANIYDMPFVPIRPGDVVFDIGANHGFYACWAARQGAIVHAFEPDPNTFNLLLKNISINGLEGRVFAHQFAIAAETGSLPMYCTADLGGGMSTIIPAFAVKSGMEVMSQSKVNALTLTDAMRHCNVEHLRICKMDCEGAEYSILRAFNADQLDRFDAMVLEYHPQAYKLDQFLDVLLKWEGFHVSKVVSQDGLGNANLSILKSSLIRDWANPESTKTATGNSPRIPVSDTQHAIA